MKKVILVIGLVALTAFSCSDDDDNSISVPMAEAAIISGGPFNFVVDGEVENFVSGISIDESNAVGESNIWVITDDQLNILGLPATLDAVESQNFDGAGVGTCLIWNLRFNGEVEGAVMGENAADLEGDFALSNSITVNRVENAEAGTISGGPFNFTVDGTPDFVSGITLDNSDAAGESSTWVVTDDQGNILGLPPTLEAVEGVDFDGAGAGVCLIWYLRYEGDLEGAAMGENADDLEGNFDLSNPITVNRT
ncbi:hypothetical protein GCM10009117_11560 [Gangjinia marincola]|uniref:Uncharacterized protein n=1 Tax=Gangjinia marincola TaxID=578463 RepID=A0ABP3XUH1_9FLAO